MSNSFEKEIESPEIDTIANLAEHMVYRLPGCADIMIRKELQRSYYDFARRSVAFTSTIVIPIEKFKREYQLSANIPRMQICSVREVLLDGRKLSKGEYEVHNDVLFILPNVVLDGHMFIRVYIQETPRFGAEDAPRWFLEKYGEAIIAGAMSRLFAMNGKPWSDPAQAQSELVTWENYIHEVRVDSMTRGTNNGNVDVLDTSGLL